MIKIDREKLLPMMRQYYDIKEKYPNCLLFYRLGDFYEMFFQDALEASAFLGLTLTGRECGLNEKAPMCGVPFHSAQNYIDKLVAGGYKVAICEQLEDAGAGKKLVERDVIRVITAGTITSDNILDTKANNFLCSVYFWGSIAGIATCDITTGELYCTELWGVKSENELFNEVLRYNPSEIIISDKFPNAKLFMKQVKLRLQTSFSIVSDKYYDTYDAEERIKKQFGKKYERMGQATSSVIGSILQYIEETQKCSLPNITKINLYTTSEFLQMDYNSRRNLEITETMRDGKKKGSLLSVIDGTVTSMGSRLLRNWLDKPLIDVAQIQRRQEMVSEFYNNLILSDDMRVLIKTVNDIERLNSKIVIKTANARDVFALGNSIEKLPELLNVIKPLESSIAKEIVDNFDVLSDIYSLIKSAIEDAPPMTTREGGIIKKGYNAQIDKYRIAMEESTSWLTALEEREKEKTGIKTLKVAYNKVAGFYIEVSRGQAKNVPDEYVQKGTLTNSIRYITGELKEIENSVLSAKERRCQLEYELFMDLLEKISAEQARVLQMAQNIAKLDVFSGLAKIAYENNYICPKVRESGVISIKGGRHPVVEKFLQEGDFIANDTFLSVDERFAIITGPNMAGKSTYMRQVAIIILLSQIGSFVPAESAEIGVVDKIFTRVGASDDLAGGQSTFMVEMAEVANILNNATQKSFIILDEIGRGTSTYDGLAIAQAVTEYIAKTICAKTIFATHYHELTVLEGQVEGVKNYCVSAEKHNENIVFLRKIIPGGADESFGIEVAKLAGVSDVVVRRANEIVAKLENIEYA